MQSEQLDLLGTQEHLAQPRWDLAPAGQLRDHATILEALERAELQADVPTSEGALTHFEIRPAVLGLGAFTDGAAEPAPDSMGVSLYGKFDIELAAEHGTQAFAVSAPGHDTGVQSFDHALRMERR